MSQYTTVEVKVILEPHGLLAAYAYFLANNPGNDLPYHNLFHANCVIVNCAAGAVEMQLPQERVKPLLLAAMFHDFAHSGGRKKDDENIRQAVAGLQAYCATDNISGEILAEATGIIEITQYPPEREPGTLSQAIIRDADLMQMYAPNWEKQIFVGLRREMETATGKEIGFSDMVSMQLKFMENIGWQTSWAENRAAREWGALVENVKLLAPEKIGF